MTVKVDVSYGELLDKISILEIKIAHATAPSQRANIQRELDILSAARRDLLPTHAELEGIYGALKTVNQKLWKIEDDIRDCERRQDFGPSFVALARSVYVSNDERAALKRRINDLLGSPLVEEKLYQSY